jgi:hypothetical protein
MLRHSVIIASSFLLAGSAFSAPIVVAGFVFPEGEAAFADDAVHVSGPVLDPNTVRNVLTGSYVGDSFNTGDSNSTVIEVRFLDNAIKNDQGADLVIFELSGDQPVGTPDPREIFDVAVPVGAGFSQFVRVTPIATGWNDPADASLDVFSIQIDLSAFGLGDGVVIDRVRVGVFNANLGSKSADLTALGALHSTAAVPEPSTASMLLLGLCSLATLRGMRATS